MNIPPNTNVSSLTVHVALFPHILQEGKLLDTQSHVLFQPLPCQIPLDGFQGLKFCVSQYNDRDRKLLRRLCHVLKVKFTERFNSKVTHLLCKVQAGEKYESACKLGVPSLTADWLYACIAQVICRATTEELGLL